jgi:hypothetical protein
MQRAVRNKYQLVERRMKAFLDTFATYAEGVAAQDFHFLRANIVNGASSPHMNVG